MFLKWYHFVNFLMSLHYKRGSQSYFHFFTCCPKASSLSILDLNSKFYLAHDFIFPYFHIGISHFIWDMIVQTQLPCQQKDSCSGEVGKPQSEHMKGVVTAG